MPHEEGREPPIWFWFTSSVLRAGKLHQQECQQPHQVEDARPEHSETRGSSHPELQEDGRVPSMLFCESVSICSAWNPLDQPAGSCPVSPTACGAAHVSATAHTSQVSRSGASDLHVDLRHSRQAGQTGQAADVAAGQSVGAQLSHGAARQS